MKKLGFGACLLALGGIGAMGANACSSSSSPSSGSGSSSGVEEASAESGSSSGGTEDSSGSSGSSSGAGSDDGSSSGGDAAICQPNLDGGDAAFSCPVSEGGTSPPAPAIGSMGCNVCIEECCSDPYCACAGDSYASEAGLAGGCLAYVACVRNCLAPPADSGADAGTLMQCDATCAPAYTPGQVAAGRALLTCITQSCGTTATCGQ